MRVLFDTNVILDVMLDRMPFSEPAGELLTYVEKGDISGFICATTVTTIHYLATKTLGSQPARNHIKTLMKLFDIAPVDRDVIKTALSSKFTDFEDAVVYHAARQVGTDAIITRDAKGFKASEIPVYPPAEMLAMIEATDLF